MKVFVLLLSAGFDWIHFDHCFLGHAEHSRDER